LFAAPVLCLISKTALKQPTQLALNPVGSMLWLAHLLEPISRHDLHWQTTLEQPIVKDCDWPGA
jgi:hypothetical protein